MYPEATKAALAVQGYATRMTKLQAAISYEQDDTMGARPEGGAVSLHEGIARVHA